MDKNELIEAILERMKERLKTYTIEELEKIVNELDNSEISW